MNLNELVINRGKSRAKKGPCGNKMPLMGPPIKPPPKKKNVTTSSSSVLPWGKSNISLVLNSSSNRKSTSSKSSSTDVEHKTIVAITEGRGEARCEVGIAVINVARPHLVLCQTSDTQSYINTLTKINILNPHEIIYPTTFEIHQGKRLIAEIRKHFPNKKYTPVNRQYFNKGNGLDRLHKLCTPSSYPLLLMLKNRYYALAAVSALLTYLQDNLYVYYANNSIKIDYQASEGYAIIDISTADRLELVCSTQVAQANKYSSLFGIMNRCITKVGSRTLRSIILQPLYSIEKIEERLDCVSELIKHPEVLLSLQGLLPKLSNVDHLLTIGTLVPEDPQRCSNRQLNYLLLLNSIVDVIVPLKEILKNVQRPFFIQFREILEGNKFESIKTLIRQTIHEDAYPAKGQLADTSRIFAIKPGLNGLLDLVRKTYSERIEDMREYVKRLGEKYDLTFTLANNNKKGYHIVLGLNQQQKKYMKTSDLPEEFIQVFRLANSFTMKTPELVNLSTRIDDILTDLFTISNLMLHSIIVQVKQYADLFYELVDNIAYLDVLQSLAEISCANGYVRPTFDQYTEVISSYHPLLDFLCPSKPIPNSIVSCEHYNIHLMTGPNGAGKSIFIRQTMLIQIMAQTGCFVPAQSAIFRPADRMFARVSNEDDMECGASSFVLEMTEINYILSTMTDASLIIIDELCRSTSVEEGTAIAMAICDQLAHSRAYVYVTTHFTLITKIAELFLNVKVWQMETIPSGDRNNPKSLKLDFKFSLMPGVTTLIWYGIYMVRNIWPVKILRYVEELQTKVSKKPITPNITSIDKRARLKHELVCRFSKLKSQKKLTVSNINTYLNDYYQELERIGDDIQNSQISFKNLDDTELNHSIFDVSQVIQPNQPSMSSSMSQIFLDNLTPERTASQMHLEPQDQESISSTSLQIFPDNLRSSQISRSQKLLDLQDQELLVREALNSHSQVSSVFSPNQAKARMKHIFTPDQSLQYTQTSSCHTSDDLIHYNSQRAYNLIPEVIMQYSGSESSLHFSQNALGLLKNTYNRYQSPNNSIQGLCLSQNHSLSQDATQNNFEYQIFDRDGVESRCPSQMSDEALSVELERIRHKRVSLEPYRTPSEFLRPQIPTQMPTRAPLKSSTMGQFAFPLQTDITKTSTPLLGKGEDTRRESPNIGFEYDEFYRNQKLEKPIPRFTILNNVEGVDMASVQEELESFVEDLATHEWDEEEEKNSENLDKINEELEICSSLLEEDKEGFDNEEQESLKANKESRTITEIDSTAAVTSNNQNQIWQVQEQEDSNASKIKKTSIQLPTIQEQISNVMIDNFSSPRAHIFPIVNIIEGPDNPTPSTSKTYHSNSPQELEFNNLSLQIQVVNDQNHDLLEAFDRATRPNIRIFPTIDITNDPTESFSKENEDLVLEVSESSTTTTTSSHMSYSPLGSPKKSDFSKQNKCELKKDERIGKVDDVVEISDCEENMGQTDTEITEKQNKDHFYINLSDNIFDRSTDRVVSTDSETFEEGGTETEKYYKTKIDYVNKDMDLKEEHFKMSSKNVHKFNGEDKSEAGVFRDDEIKLVQNDTNQKQEGICSSAINNIVEETHQKYKPNKITVKDVNKTNGLAKKPMKTFEDIPNSSYYNDNINYPVKKKIVKRERKRKSTLGVPRRRHVIEHARNINKNRKIKADKGRSTENTKFNVDDIVNDEEHISVNNTNEISTTKIPVPGLSECSRKIDVVNIATTSIDSLQKTPIGKKTRTNISEVSKLRNLVENHTSTTTTTSKDKSKSNSDSHDEIQLNGEKTMTSVSDASRKRNLDQVTTSSCDDPQNITSSSVKDTSDESSTPKKKAKRPVKKFTVPRKQKKKPSNGSTSTSVAAEDSMSKNVELPFKQKFVVPRKLSRKQIMREFLEQDKRILETSESSSDIAKLWEQRLNRPTPRQIQQSTCVATLRKTSDGVKIIPTPTTHENKRKYQTKYSREMGKIFTSDSSINMNIFSDRNAETFEKFINSDKKDYKSFNFNFGYQENKPREGMMFDFKQVNASTSEYLNNSISMTFVRRRSDELMTISQESGTQLPFLTQPQDFSLTPRGFYKDNKDDITNIVNKYL